ncbi:type II secretion system protein [Undibacterium sp. Ji83W]|uniref:type II secretion system protein n=1 Tax=Undibacterium sp. Ji83W TaxID=3413043 RepID=UPI003BF2E992
MAYPINAGETAHSTYTHARMRVYLWVRQITCKHANRHTLKHVHKHAGAHGFTLIELLVVLAILSLLLTISVPRYFHSIQQSREAVLKKNLHVTREVIDKFYGDTGRYPQSLDELVERRYLRSLPLDPVTDSSATWVLVAPEKGSGVYDIQSGAPGATREGLPFSRL